VSIHIRRTDTLLPKFVNLKGVIPIQFYLDAIKYIQDRTGPLHVYFFSDDINWVKENLILKDMPLQYIDKSVTNLAIED
ncbi:alpha-1,2-fucosyltransferase, partial [Salmonella sp. SAL4443]|uniref:alpha-1,2-fucosyltransferase n=1 Tax=Salmonella sp. SAL4443 TaxID=3159898 RepID=UPI00397DC08C